MSYEDLPVGTVLRNPDTGSTFVRVATADGWVLVNASGIHASHPVRLLRDGLVELVEKPAKPTKQPTPAKLLDGDGDLWVLVEGDVYHLASSRDFRRDRAFIDECFGPVTEVTD